MIIVDTALEKRHSENNPVKVGIIGAGYMGRGVALQIISAFKGMKLVAVSNRTLSEADKAYRQADVKPVSVETVSKLDEMIALGKQCITDDALLLCQAENIDVLIEATGEIDFGAQVTLKALEHKKHIVLMNAELDATIGPVLKVHADRAGVILTNADGDQPGVVMNLLRFVKTIGYHPVLAGNIKGMQDHYRTPETQKGFAEKYKQKPKMITSFADGTKISMEMAVVANATGFKVGKRGMYGPECSHATQAIDLFPKEQMLNGGLVDFILGAEPGPGVFVIGYNDHPIQQQYANYFKMGEGPFYIFYVPYHLPHLEAPITAARAALFNDAAVAPLGGPVAEVITMAKRDLKAGDRLDGIGGFDTYGTLENYDEAQNLDLLPMGLSEGCEILRDLKIDEAISYEDVLFPEERVADKLRKEQNQFF